MGYEKFAIQAKDKGVDGVLLVDSPPEESEVINNAIGQEQFMSDIFGFTDHREIKGYINNAKHATGFSEYGLFTTMRE